MRSHITGSEVRVVGRGVKIGTGSEIVGKRVVIGQGTQIGSGVSIRADEIKIGSMCDIEDRVRVYWRGGTPRSFRLGDCCTVGSDSKFYVREFSCGDYVALHNHILVNGDTRCSVGHNSYIGQNCILNANAPVKIGNGVGMVAYSAVWTHGRFGELIEGSTVHKEAPVTIDDDVTIWRAIISPGVRVGRRATILNGAVITKDVAECAVVGGIPASDLGKKMPAYRRVSLDEKFTLMKDFMTEFLETVYPGEWAKIRRGEFEVNPRRGEPFRIIMKEELKNEDIIDGSPILAVTARNGTRRLRNGRVSVFEVKSKTYTKRLTEPEVRFMKFLLDARARFVPAGTPRLEARHSGKELLIGRC
jgi:acetyltransferase-like isoleucine patch superfamily enzyme